MKKPLWITLIMLALITGILLLWKPNFLWRSNKITVTVEDNLDLSKVKIVSGEKMVDIRRLNDKELFDGSILPQQVLFDAGRPIEEITESYSSNDFIITYDTTYYALFYHNKSNPKDKHDYYFHFFNRTDGPAVHIEVKGHNWANGTYSLNKISESEYYTGSLPVPDLLETINSIQFVPEE